MANTKFIVGHIYEMKYRGDHELTAKWYVVGRTKQFVTISDGIEVKRCKVYVKGLNDDTEVLRPEGIMGAYLYASNIIG